MARFFPKKRIFPREVRDFFKTEVARELSLEEQIRDGYWGEVKAKDCGRVGGKIGGSMVRAMIRRAEEALARGEKV
ncbi:hypothetical protein Adeg_0597 [Ammonifex degensii KC4]|uniref:Alpha/beta-type small acid-soluble spore protein n=1 Tax=Ammonifex degensii (strain DSM 10501 / KC4) TaxID=429009 RepID=C9RBW8_AMMDK|nr:alpha/beta-type small acid-soluble spore protein [Ammonifex degensii]ACX51745.1 hypothetical protein Adeg_0597 [Ammonifex degensii KC4]